MNQKAENNLFSVLTEIEGHAKTLILTHLTFRGEAMKKYIFIVFLLTISFFGCVTTGKFQNLSLGMTKEQVEETIGKPTAVRGAKIDEQGKENVVWEYIERKDTGLPVPYWFYFTDGILKQWGEAGDWKPDATIEFRNR